MRTHSAGLLSRAALIGGAAAVFLAPGALAAQDVAIKNATILTITRGDIANGDRKSTRLNSSHSQQSRMPSSA